MTSFKRIGKYKWRDGRPHQFYQDKKRDFELRTGVRWSVSHAHGNMVFLPCIDFRSVADVQPDPSVALKVEDAIRRGGDDLTGFVSFLDVHNDTRVPFATLFQVVKHLVKNGKARLTVNRMGDGTYVKLTD